MSDLVSPVDFSLIWEEIMSGDEELVELVELLPELGVQLDEPTTSTDTQNIDQIHQPQPQASNEFISVSTEDVRTFIDNEQNKNTKKKTISDIRKFERFLSSKGEHRDLTKLAPECLDEHVAGFILSVRKGDGTEYEPSSIRGMVSSIERKLKKEGYSHQILNDTTNVFQLTRDALRAKQKQLKRQGRGNKPQRSNPITDQEIESLYEKQILGKKTAKSLLNTIWLNNCILFGLRGTKENYDLRWGDVMVLTGSDGLEYLELQERQTKTRTGTNICDVREVTPKIYATPEDPDRCPVEMLKLYASKRPVDFCKSDDPFYISARTSSQIYLKDTWFMKSKIGEKKLGSLLKVMATEGGLDTHKRLTNHSTRKHLVQKLRDSGIAPTDIMQISGHKNVQSVLNYSAMSESKQKECSKILSTVRPISTVTETAPIPLKSNSSVSLASSNSDTNTSLALEPMSTESPDTVTAVPHPPVSNIDQQNQGNSISFQNDSLTVNNQMNSLFSGAVLNIQNFNLYMK